MLWHATPWVGSHEVVQTSFLTEFYYDANSVLGIQEIVDVPHDVWVLRQPSQRLNLSMDNSFELFVILLLNFAGEGVPLLVAALVDSAKGSSTQQLAEFVLH